MKACHHGTYENARCLNCEMERDKLRIATLATELDHKSLALKCAVRYNDEDKAHIAALAAEHANYISMADPIVAEVPALRTRIAALEATLRWALGCIDPGAGPQFEEVYVKAQHVLAGSSVETPAKLQYKCMACRDEGWLWDVNKRVPCDVCEAGPAWLHAQTL